MQPQRYVGQSDFARAVAESDFGRVCPKCYHQWSDKLTFMRETKVVGSETSINNVTNPVTKEVTTVQCPKRIHEHHCGGQMYIDIPVRESNKLQDTKKQKGDR
jgi:hypothetical protein